MRRRNASPLESLLQLTVSLPWWLGATLAVASFLLMRWLANIDGPVRTSPSEAASAGAWKGIATFLMIALPFAFGLGAVASLVNRLFALVPPKEKRAADRDPRAYVPPPVVTTEWNLPLLQALEWKRFEYLCAEYFRELGFRAETVRAGADGGVDIRLHADGQVQPAILVQCKSWRTWQVGVKEVRELYGVMAAEGVSEGVLITTGTLTADAQAFADGRNVHLIDGADFLSKLQALAPETQHSLLQFATRGDYTTPTCPTCGATMVRRAGRGNRPEFWGCGTFPTCRTTLQSGGRRLGL